MINSIILSLTIIIIVFGFIWFTIQREKKLAEDNIERFREFVRASKSKNLEEYEQSLPFKGDLPQINQDELVDLDQIDPIQLLKTVKEE